MDWPRFIWIDCIFSLSRGSPGCLCYKCLACTCNAERGREKSSALKRQGFYVSNFIVVSLLRSFCFFSFHDYLSHPLRQRWGGVLSEPKCPSVCSTKYSLGIKPKPQASTPWNNSRCHSSEIFHYNLLNFKTDWQRDKSWGPDATCLFRVMKSRLRRGLWPFNLSPSPRDCLWACLHI